LLAKTNHPPDTKQTKTPPTADIIHKNQSPRLRRTHKKQTKTVEPRLVNKVARKLPP
jgi:hypothetical protein